MKKLAEFEAFAAVESRSKLIDEHNSAFRWIVASLFALNGGAILSILSSGNMDLPTIFPAFWVFFGGIVANFLAVLFTQISNRQMIARMHSWGLYWATVGVTAERDHEHETAIKHGIAKAEHYGRFGHILAFFAMIFFVLGVLATVVLEQRAAIEKLESEIERIQIDRAE